MLILIAKTLTCLLLSAVEAVHYTLVFVQSSLIK